MKAKFIYEGLDDILKSRTDDEIVESLSLKSFIEAASDVRSQDKKSKIPVLIRAMDKFKGNERILAITALIDSYAIMQIPAYEVMLRKKMGEVIGGLKLNDLVSDVFKLGYPKNDKYKVFDLFFSDVFSHNSKNKRAFKKDYFRLLDEFPEKEYIEKVFADVDNTYFSDELNKRLKRIVSKQKPPLPELRKNLPWRFSGRSSAMDVLKPYITGVYKSLSLKEKIHQYFLFHINEIEEMLLNAVTNTPTAKLIQLYLYEKTLVGGRVEESNTKIPALRLVLRKRKDLKDVMDKLSSKELTTLYNEDKKDGIAKYASQLMSSSESPNELLMKGVQSGSTKMVKAAVEKGADMLWYSTSEEVAEVISDAENDWNNRLKAYHINIVRVSAFKDGRIEYDELQNDGEWETETYGTGLTSFYNNYSPVVDDKLLKKFNAVEKVLNRNKKYLNKAQTYITDRKDFIKKYKPKK